MIHYADLRYCAILGILFLSTLLGCDNHARQKKFSSDKNALKNIIELDVNASAVTWEKFGWPEKSSSELLEANLDYIILVAEIAPTDKRFFDSLSSGEMAYIVPGAARRWLSQKSRITLENRGSTSMDLSRKSDCRPLVVSLKKTGQPAKGFMCNTGENAVIYLVLASYT